MGIRSVFKSGLGKSSPNGLYEMAKKHDVVGLIDHIDKVNYDHIPLVFQYLTDLSENGWHDLIISHGIIPRAIEFMRSGSPAQKKAAMFLLYSLISHNRGDIVLINDGVIEAALDMLDEKDDKELQRGVAYCMAMLCPLGGSVILVDHKGIEKIAPLVRSDDDNTVLYALFTLNSLASMGYQKEILITRVHKHIGYHMSGNPEIESLGQMLLDDLYDWKEESFSVDEEDLEIVDERLELIGLEDGYVRPETKKARIEPRDGTILGYDGKEIPQVDEREVMIELKSRRLLSRRKMKERGEKLQKMMDKRMKKKSKDKTVKARMIRQRVVKKTPIKETVTERKVKGVTSGSLDKVEADPAEPTLEKVEGRKPPEAPNSPAAQSKE